MKTNTIISKVCIIILFSLFLSGCIGENTNKCYKPSDISGVHKVIILDTEYYFNLYLNRGCSGIVSMKFLDTNENKNIILDVFNSSKNQKIFEYLENKVTIGLNPDTITIDFDSFIILNKNTNIDLKKSLNSQEDTDKILDILDMAGVI